NQQDESGSSKQQQQHRTHLTDNRVTQPLQLDPGVTVRLRIQLCQVLGDGVHVRVRLLDRDSRLQPRNHIEPVQIAARNRVTLGRRQKENLEVANGSKLEIARQYSDNHRIATAIAVIEL